MQNKIKAIKMEIEELEESVQDAGKVLLHRLKKGVVDHNTEDYNHQGVEGNAKLETLKEVYNFLSGKEYVSRYEDHLREIKNDTKN